MSSLVPALQCNGLAVDWAVVLGCQVNSSDVQEIVPLAPEPQCSADCSESHQRVHLRFSLSRSSLLAVFCCSLRCIHPSLRSICSLARRRNLGKFSEKFSNFPVAPSQSRSVDRFTAEANMMDARWRLCPQVALLRLEWQRELSCGAVTPRTSADTVL
jgi:hypothetical protein